MQSFTDAGVTTFLNFNKFGILVCHFLYEINDLHVYLILILKIYYCSNPGNLEFCATSHRAHTYAPDRA